MSKRRLVGTIVSDKMDKTVVVEIEWVFHHPQYRKVLRKLKKYKAHDELGAQVGQKVEIEECRPRSKEKKFRVVRIVEDGEIKQ